MLDRSGVGRSTCYLHFRDKDHLRLYSTSQKSHQAQRAVCWTRLHTTASQRIRTQNRSLAWNMSAAPHHRGLAARNEWCSHFPSAFVADRPESRAPACPLTGRITLQRGHEGAPAWLRLITVFFPAVVVIVVRVTMNEPARFAVST